MSRYIDADALAKKLTDWSTGTVEPIDWSDIAVAPSIDLVRCGECIHNGSFDMDCPFGWKNGEWNMPRPCDFCSYGEREGE